MTLKFYIWYTPWIGILAETKDFQFDISIWRHRACLPHWGKTDTFDCIGQHSQSFLIIGQKKFTMIVVPSFKRAGPELILNQLIDQTLTLWYSDQSNF